MGVTVMIWVWVVSVILATMVGNRVDQPVGGFLVGLVFGPLGVLIVALYAHVRTRSCPSCGKVVRTDINVCPFCGRPIG